MIQTSAKSNFLDSDQTARISNFYEQGSIHVPNKYVVGLFGEAVNGSIQYLSDYAVHDPLLGEFKMVKKVRLYSGILTRWLNIHCPDMTITQDVFSNGNIRDMVDNVNAVELLWACESIKFSPSITPKVKKDLKMDTYKNITYPIIMGHEGPGDITVTITEDRTLMFYQFFNALMNQFFDPLILKARSSFHKLGMYMIVMDGFSMPNMDRIPNERNETSKWVVEDVPLQVFEFNSIIPTSISPIEYSQGSDKKASFTVTFSAPNMFQDPFKTTSNYRGLRDNTSANSMIDSTMTKSKDYVLSYNKGNLEESSDIKAVKRGNYKELMAIGEKL
jgi:hypothetical protein